MVDEALRHVPNSDGKLSSPFDIKKYIHNNNITPFLYFQEIIKYHVTYKLNIYTYKVDTFSRKYINEGVIM